MIYNPDHKTFAVLIRYNELNVGIEGGNLYKEEEVIMFTLVGLQSDFGKALKELIELDYDAIEAYEIACNKLTNEKYKAQIKEFKADHEKHVKELTQLLARHNVEVPTGASIGNQWLTKGKVILGSLVGDISILKAMLSNEIDTNTAYERMRIHENMWEDATDILNHGLQDEKKHKSWLENVIQ